MTYLRKADIKNAWRYTSTPTRSFMAKCLMKYKNAFNITAYFSANCTASKPGDCHVSRHLSIIYTKRPCHGSGGQPPVGHAMAQAVSPRLAMPWLRRSVPGWPCHGSGSQSRRAFNRRLIPSTRFMVYEVTVRQFFSHYFYFHLSSIIAQILHIRVSLSNTDDPKTLQVTASLNRAYLCSSLSVAHF